MPFGAHRDGDLRSCGAVTIVTNQSTVFVNNKLWAVKGDRNNHINGALKNTTGDSILIENKEVIVHGPDQADPDNLCPISGGKHCNPETAQGSGDTLCY